MSGFAAVVYFDRAPIEPQLLACLSRSLRFRAPDGEHVQQLDGVGLAHAQMQIPGDPPQGSQPLCLDERWWIVAHARFYDRDGLVGELSSAGAAARTDQPDAWLILLAYRAWGTQCLERFNGDFSFALWDARERELFCASDPFGSRPLFYSSSGHVIQVSNTLSALRDVFGHRGDLNDSYIADFLCFEFSLSPEATAFRKIHRLPPGHMLTMRTGHGPVLRRYWDPPTPAVNLASNPADTVAEFRHHLERAILDRVPDGPVSLALSGGMDSTSIAAIAARAGVKRLKTFTRGSVRRVEDPEPELAALVAKSLNLQHQLRDSDQDVPFDDWARRMPFMPEPVNDPYWSGKHTGRQALSSHSRVVLSGEGGDELLCPEFACDLLSGVPLHRVVHDIVRYVRHYRRRPPLGLRRALDRWRGHVPDYGSSGRPPLWLNAELVREWRLDERMRDFFREAMTPARHATRPNGARHLTEAIRLTHGADDPGTMGLPLEWRKPFLDRRLVEFMYSIPPLYWCCRKTILREAMTNCLPEEIVRRRKTGVRANEFEELWQDTRAPWLENSSPAEQLGRYVELASFAELRNRAKGDARTPEAMRRDLLPVCLNYWLKSLSVQL
jgi:asparagine synthase (glutamine-hydrolysing)